VNKREARRVALRLAAQALWAWEATEEEWHEAFPPDAVPAIRSELVAISRELELRAGEPTTAAARRYLTGDVPEDVASQSTTTTKE
jgi:hypothetical protein